MCLYNYNIYENILPVSENIDYFLPLRIQEILHADSYLPSYPSEEYWASLQESAFIGLVQMFKAAVIAQLNYWAGTAENNYHIKTLLEMLKKLHRVSAVLETHVSLFCNKNSLGFTCLET